MSDSNAPNAPSRYAPGLTNRDVEMAMAYHVQTRQQRHVARYGAFAYSSSTARWGWSYQASDQASAEVMARASCGTADAVAVGWGCDTYIALALGGTRGYAFAWDRLSQRAAQKALHECRSGGNCQVAAVIDTRSNPIEQSRRQSRRRSWRWVRAVISGVVAILFSPGALHEQLTGAHGVRGYSIVAISAGLLALQQASRAVTTRIWAPPPGRS
jgi:hypothetical protein